MARYALTDDAGKEIAFANVDRRVKDPYTVLTYPVWKYLQAHGKTYVRGFMGSKEYTFHLVHLPDNSIEMEVEWKVLKRARRRYK